MCCQPGSDPDTATGSRTAVLVCEVMLPEQEARGSDRWPRRESASGSRIGRAGAPRLEVRQVGPGTVGRVANEKGHGKALVGVLVPPRDLLSDGGDRACPLRMPLFALMGVTGLPN